MDALGILPVVLWEASLHDDAVNDKQYELDHGSEVDSSYRCPEARERMRFPKAVVAITTPTATVACFLMRLGRRPTLKTQNYLLRASPP